MMTYHSSITAAIGYLSGRVRGSQETCDFSATFPTSWSTSSAGISERIVASLERTNTSLGGRIPMFAYMTKGCGEVYIGYGSRSESSGPYFVAERFEAPGELIKLFPIVLLKTTRRSWPEMQLKVTCSTPIEISTSLTILSSLSTSFDSDDFSNRIPPHVSSHEVGMSREEYAEAVTSTINDMREGSLRKVVFSRCVQYNMACPVSPFALLHRVLQATESSDGTKRYVVILNPEGGNDWFVSVTPERLCRIEKNSISTEALAGTYSTDCRPEIVSGCGEKIVTEHGAVAEYITGKLRDIAVAGEVNISPLELLNLRDMCHVRQKFDCYFSEDQSVPSMASWAMGELSPTPAVCGFPVAVAREEISTFEKFSRNFFSAPMGIVDGDKADICVAIRAARVTGFAVQLYAGAGLVPGSDWESEWEEMDLKMGQFRAVIEGVNRPIFEYLNRGVTSTYTEVYVACIVEELVRNGCCMFVVCPGSRSTPLTIAVNRNSAARAVVVHDERCAGFYALGLAKAGKKVAVIVTSGTAVANLAPAVCEARESGIGFILLTADRPSCQWDIGESQTIRQADLFGPVLCGFVKSIPPPPCSSIESVIGDISFAIGETVTNRRQIAHVNLEFEKSELQPIERGRINIFENTKTSALRVKAWGTEKLTPFVTHINAGATPGCVPSELLSAIYAGACIVICGELRSVEDAGRLKQFCERMNIVCVADTSSLMTSSDHVFTGIDQLMAHGWFKEYLGRGRKVVLRLGGQIISARIQSWVLDEATVVRVKDDQFARNRHDPGNAADVYIHSRLDNFLDELEMRVGKVFTLPKNIPSKPPKHPSLSSLIRSTYRDGLAAISPPFNEMTIAQIVGEECPTQSFFLSASMPCRDFDLFAGLRETPNPTRLVACNRGANGIDGVISTALGYSRGTNTQCVVMIGDVATLHDIGALSLVSNCHPGQIRTEPLGDVKIVCINNDGGAIFSFLPVKALQNDFHPYFDTPHNLELGNIANAFAPGTAVVATSGDQLRKALHDPAIKFIECRNLPNHETNVELHKTIGAAVAQIISVSVLG